MRRVLLTLAAFAIVIVGLAASTATAGHGHRGYYGGFGHGQHGYHHQYGHRYARSYSPHLEAVRRIKAAHSRYRYHTHPRSMYNSPPHPYDYWGW